ncbi:hypothetical protein O2K51_08535 [Apibacter raozihei]|uniref:DUF6702 family protein n=1 Tax=Apibacter TaxID=1778601 RepID=UPI000FE398D9|nr:MULTISPECIES: DUF6702 family protein [Apibacter]
MKKIILSIIPLALLAIFAFYSSEFYTSITKVEYVSNNKTLKISSKVNAAHIEQAVGKKTDASDFDSSLSKYLQNNVKISVNDSPVNYSFSSKNKDGNVVWIYYEVAGVDNISSITMKNTLLLDKFPEQQNFTNFIINGQKKSFVCKKGSESGKVNF